MENDERDFIIKKINEKGIKLKSQYHKIPPTYESQIYLDEDNLLHFPVLIVFEEFNVTDYLRDVVEDSMISEILELLFTERHPADKEKLYNKNTVKCYLEMSDFDTLCKKEVNVYYPIREDESIIDILRNKQVYMNGIPVILIVSQISKFNLHFLKNYNVLSRSGKRISFHNTNVINNK
jgi:hypothetical protein